MDYNYIITEEVIENLPNENLFSPENKEYFDSLYTDFIEMALSWEE